MFICSSAFLPSGSLASGQGSYEVASPASQELYVFDVNGTHQFTMSLVTGDYKYNFSYRLVCVSTHMVILTRICKSSLGHCLAGINRFVLHDFPMLGCIHLYEPMRISDQESELQFYALL